MSKNAFPIEYLSDTVPFYSLIASGLMLDDYALLLAIAEVAGRLVDEMEADTIDPESMAGYLSQLAVLIEYLEGEE